ncbi:hypothetical protein GJ496_008107, partial [Pomphorhynchus laevis]
GDTVRITKRNHFLPTKNELDAELPLNQNNNVDESVVDILVQQVIDQIRSYYTPSELLDAEDITKQIIEEQFEICPDLCGEDLVKVIVQEFIPNSNYSKANISDTNWLPQLNRYLKCIEDKIGLNRDDEHANCNQSKQYLLQRLNAINAKLNDPLTDLPVDSDHQQNSKCQCCKCCNHK